MQIKRLRIPLVMRGPRPWRPQWLPWWMKIRSESEAHPHCPEERPELFLAYNVATTEMEVLNWLYASVLLFKPKTILETGAADGIGTIALAAACKANGFGRVHSIEIVPKTAQRAGKRLGAAGLSDYVDIHCVDSMEFLKSTDLHFDFGFFDSLCQIRPEEYQTCYDRGILKGPAVFHDTSPLRNRSYDDPPPEIHNAYRKRLFELAKLPGHTGYFDSPLSRGLFAIFSQSSIE